MAIGRNRAHNCMYLMASSGSAYFCITLSGTNAPLAKAATPSAAVARIEPQYDS